MNAPRPLLVGLTGGIASGKTAVSDMFADLGIPVIDTDVVAREVVAPGSDGLAAIVEAFGSDVLQADGALDRRALRGIVFADADARQRLEAITHPLIREQTMRQSAAAGGAYQVIVVPLLVESPMRHAMDSILVVDVPESVQLERLRARDGEDEAQARRMIAAQASRDERLALADQVVRNDGSLADTRRQVEALHAAYLDQAAAR